MSILFKTDAYKLSHISMYPKNTTKVFANFTPRDDKWSLTKKAT